MQKTLIPIDELAKMDGALVWIERLDHPKTDIQGWVRILLKFTHKDAVIGFRYINGITGFSWREYGSCWVAYKVDFDINKGIPVLYCGEVTTLQNMESGGSAHEHIVYALKEILADACIAITYNGRCVSLEFLVESGEISAQDAEMVRLFYVRAKQRDAEALQNE